MKKRLTRNIGLKILSVILAALLWLFITNIDDPIKTQLFANTPVTILNGNAIDEPNQVYEIIEGETVTFRVSARRSILEGLTKDDFAVTADFSKLLNGNTVMIDISPKRMGNEIKIEEGKYQTLTIKLEELSEEDFKVNVVPVGEVGDGFHISGKTASPNIIRVSGPKGRIEKIKEVVAEVDVEGANRSYTKIAEPKAVDEDGKVIDASKLTFSSRYIEINLSLFKTKTVDLDIKTEGNPASGHIVTGIEYEPKTIVIAAEDDVLKEISSLPIIHNIDGAMDDIEMDINLRDELQLPKGVLLVEDNISVSINIKIERLETKEIVIWPNDIVLRNKEDNLLSSFNTNGPIRLKVTGLAKDVETLSRTTLDTYLDLTDYEIGTYVLPLKAVLPENTIIEGVPMISLNLAR